MKSECYTAALVQTRLKGRSFLAFGPQLGGICLISLSGLYLVEDQPEVFRVVPMSNTVSCLPEIYRSWIPNESFLGLGQTNIAILLGFLV